MGLFLKGPLKARKGVDWGNRRKGPELSTLTRNRFTAFSAESDVMFKTFRRCLNDG